MDYFVIGLGNPGTQYQHTRHNVAWIVLHKLLGAHWEEDKYLKAQYLNNDGVHFLLPQTYMNKSGESVAGLKKIFSSFTPQRLIVIYDDIDLPLGSVRISFDRGSGGHNGVKSVTHHIGSQKFIRIRIGVAKRLEDGRIVKPPVLGRFEKTELEVVYQLVDSVGEMLRHIQHKGYEDAMNTFNTKNT